MLRQLTLSFAVLALVSSTVVQASGKASDSRMQVGSFSAARASAPAVPREPAASVARSSYSHLGGESVILIAGAFLIAILSVAVVAGGGKSGG